MRLSTLSSRKSFVSAKKRPRKALFSADEMNIIRRDSNLTSRGTLTLVHELRMIAGSKVIESWTKEKLDYNNHKLDSFIEHKELRFAREIKGKKTTKDFQQHIIVTTNVSSFIDEVMQSRELDENTTLIKIGLGISRGFIKIFLSLLNLYATELVSKKTFCKKFKNTMKVFIVCIAPKPPENY